MDEEKFLDLIRRLRKDCTLFGDVLNYLSTGDSSDSTDRRSIDRLRRIAVDAEPDVDEYQHKIYTHVCSRCVNRPVCKCLSFVKFGYKNVVVNDFHGSKEVIIFPKPLKCIEECVNVDIDHTRTFIDVGKFLFPKDENRSNARFLENMQNSNRQSVDNFWGYALSNHWDYFITLTTDPKKVDRYDDSVVKDYCWRNCRRKLQRFDPDVKILLVPERHHRINKNGERALHFHGFVATSKPFTLKLIYENGKPLLSATGAPLFDFPFWDYGMASCAILYSDYMFSGEYDVLGADARNVPQRRIVAYMNKYMGKELGSIGYNQKRFFKTRNVVAKDKSIENYTDAEQQQHFGVRIKALEDGTYDVDMDANSEYYCYKTDDRRIILRERKEQVGEQPRVLTDEGVREVIGRYESGETVMDDVFERHSAASDKRAALIVGDSGMCYVPIAEAERLEALGEVEYVCENSQYKTYKRILKSE